MSAGIRTDLGISHRGVSFSLNDNLVQRQQRSAEQIEVIKALHHQLIDVRWAIADTQDPDQIRSLVARIEQIEFELQDAWGFERNANMHSHWLEIPGCTCPVQANRALFGHPARLIAKDCPIFGGTTRDDGIQHIPTDLSDQPRAMRRGTTIETTH